jgi:hypothetical protein
VNFNEGDLHIENRELREYNASLLDEIDHLKGVNGELCAEINRQERRIRELERERDEWQLKCCEEAGLHASHVFQRDELIRDMYESMCAVSETWAYDSYAERMRELGIEVNDD